MAVGRDLRSWMLLGCASLTSMLAQVQQIVGAPAGPLCPSHPASKRGPPPERLTGTRARSPPSGRWVL
eukprot:7288912-Alexandrium_andersonii.AAC.1